jgi:hypothetical protein
MASTMIDEVPRPPRSRYATDAWKMLKYAQQTARNLLETFDERAGLEEPGDEQQDLLRQMVVAAGTGLDAATRSLSRQALVHLLHGGDAQAAAHAIAYMKARLREQSAELTALGAVFRAEPPHVSVHELIVQDMASRDLTAGRMRSVANQFAPPLPVGPSDDPMDHQPIADAIACRNTIVDEMDVNPAGGAHDRYRRDRNEMVAHANALLGCGFAFVDHVDAQL